MNKDEKMKLIETLWQKYAYEITGGYRSDRKKIIQDYIEITGENITSSTLSNYTQKMDLEYLYATREEPSEISRSVDTSGNITSTIRQRMKEKRIFTNQELLELHAINPQENEVGLEIKKSKRQAKGSEKDPSKHLKQLAWSEQSATFFAAKKKPITLAGLKAASAVRARYRDQYPVFAIPIVGQSKQAGWCLIHATGKDLPYWTTGSKEPEWAKVKITAGSEAGLMGSAAREGETVVFKVEGVSDCLTLLSLPLPDHVGVVTNAFGCGEDPAKNPWILERFRGKIVYVIHDCDIPGQDGAIEIKNGKNTRPGWAKAIATVAKEVRNVVLPYPIEQSHGKDLRDWINEQFEAGLLPDSIVSELLAMCEKSLEINIPEKFELIDTEEPTLEDEEREHIDDPHRLARLNLRKYQESHGRSLVYWKETWYSYQGGVYQQIGTDNLISRINYSIKEEFDRAWLEEARKYKEWRKSDKYDPERDRGTPRVRKVTSALVHNVYSASKGLCTLRSGQELHDWIDRSTAPKGLCIAVGNGIRNLS